MRGRERVPKKLTSLCFIAWTPTAYYIIEGHKCETELIKLSLVVRTEEEERCLTPLPPLPLPRAAGGACAVGSVFAHAPLFAKLWVSTRD